jgi:hypothetical protein
MQVLKEEKPPAMDENRCLLAENDHEDPFIKI